MDATRPRIDSVLAAATAWLLFIPPGMAGRLAADEVAKQFDRGVVYVAAQSGDEANPEFWDERISAALHKALAGGRGREVRFPPRHIKIRKPIRLWRVRKSPDQDTTGDSIVHWNDQREHWQKIRGGKTSLIGRSVVLTSRSEMCKLIWHGPENGVMIDCPAPSWLGIRGLHFDGNDVAGVVAIRLRPGWEYRAPVSRFIDVTRCHFDRCDVCVWIGDPWQPDQTDIVVHQCEFYGNRIGVLVEGANATGIRITSCNMGQIDFAGVALRGGGSRVIRTPEQIAAEPNEKHLLKCVRDWYGREFSTADLLNTINADGFSHLLHYHQLVRAQNGTWPWGENVNVPAQVIGGGPVVEVEGLTTSSRNPAAWVFWVSNGYLAAEDVRVEGCQGVLWRGGHGLGGNRNRRFADFLTNVNCSGPGGLSGEVVHYDSIGPLYLSGCYFRGKVALRDKCTLYDTGTRWESGRTIKGEVLVSQEDQVANGWSISGPSGSLKRPNHKTLRATPVRYTGSAKPGFASLKKDGQFNLYQMQRVSTQKPSPAKR